MKMGHWSPTEIGGSILTTERRKKMKVARLCSAIAFCVCFLAVISTLLIYTAINMYAGRIHAFLPNYDGPTWLFWIVWTHILVWLIVFLPTGFSILIEERPYLPPYIYRASRIKDFATDGIDLFFFLWWILADSFCQWVSQKRLA